MDTVSETWHNKQNFSQFWWGTSITKWPITPQHRMPHYLSTQSQFSPSPLKPQWQRRRRSLHLDESPDRTCGTKRGNGLCCSDHITIKKKLFPRSTDLQRPSAARQAELGDARTYAQRKKTLNLLTSNKAQESCRQRQTHYSSCCLSLISTVKICHAGTSVLAWNQIPRRNWRCRFLPTPS